jgi:uncharacterized protein (TIGR04255 family)
MKIINSRVGVNCYLPQTYIKAHAMTEKLPTKLIKEPLIDVVFEMRFSASAPASNILPGVIFSKLDGKKNIETLPLSEIPKHIRDNDPNLQFAPTVRIQWESYLILISDKSIALACRQPYPGWSSFKQSIQKVVGLLNDVGIIEAVHRFALKYIDIIPSDNLKEQVSFTNLTAKLGSHILEKESFQFRIEIPKDNIINVIQILSSASVILADGTNITGLVIDIDTICNVPNQKITDFSELLSNNLDKIHFINKETFFDCITPETLALLEPRYD